MQSVDGVTHYMIIIIIPPVTSLESIITSTAADQSLSVTSETLSSYSLDRYMRYFRTFKGRSLTIKTKM